MENINMKEWKYNYIFTEGNKNIKLHQVLTVPLNFPRQTDPYDPCPIFSDALKLEVASRTSEYWKTVDFSELNALMTLSPDSVRKNLSEIQKSNLNDNQRIKNTIVINVGEPEATTRSFLQYNYKNKKIQLYNKPFDEE